MCSWIVVSIAVPSAAIVAEGRQVSGSDLLYKNACSIFPALLSYLSDDTPRSLSGERETGRAGMTEREVADERVRALDLAIGQIEKQFGRGAIMRLGDASARMAVEVIPTGSISLDLALGVG